MPMTILDLPTDLVKEIISRIPLKSMRAVRLTCKNWDTLSKSRSFTKMHTDTDPSTEPKGKLTCLNEQVKISQVFHCEGLLLCILEEDMFRLVVWNPYSGKTRWIEPRISYRCPYEGFDKYRYALGYENKKHKSCRSNKILRFIDLRFMDDNLGVRGYDFFWYEIYDFVSGSWTTLDVTPHWRIAFDDPGVSLNGNTYWRATYRNSNDGFVNHIICFDFTRERFGPLLPLPFTAFSNDVLSLSCVKEEKLAALFQPDHPFEIEIWITTKIEAKMMSWSKFLTVDTGTVVNIPIIFMYGSFFIDEEKKVAVVFDQDRDIPRYTANIIGEDGYFRELDLREYTERQCWPLVCSYVPSLVQIKQGDGKRKQESKLEKRRCEEKMLRIVTLEKRIKE